MITSPDQGINRHLPPEKFYWAVLEPDAIQSAGSSSRLTETQLGYLFENVLPVPLERIHSVYVPLEDGRILACGIDEDELARTITGSMLHVGPSELPAFIGEQGEGEGVRIDPMTINLLTGRHTPKAIRQLHRQWFASAAAILLLLTGLLLGGMERRARAYGHEADSLRQTAHDVMIDVLGPGSVGLMSQQPTDILFTAELRRLRQTRRANPGGGKDADNVISVDAAHRLGDLFARWPASMYIETESISLSDSHLTVTAVVASVIEANEFAESLEGLEGWQMSQPEMTNHPNRVRVIVRFKALSGKAGS